MRAWWGEGGGGRGVACAASAHHPCAHAKATVYFCAGASTSYGRRGGGHWQPRSVKNMSRGCAFHFWKGTVGPINCFPKKRSKSRHRHGKVEEEFHDAPSEGSRRMVSCSLYATLSPPEARPYRARLISWAPKRRRSLHRARPLEHFEGCHQGARVRVTANSVLRWCAPTARGEKYPVDTHVTHACIHPM